MARRKSSFSVLHQVMVLALLVAMAAPLIALHSAFAQEPEEERFRFEHAVPPVEWEVEDNRMDVDRVEFYETIDLHITHLDETDDWIPHMEILVRRNPPQMQPLTMEWCEEEMADPEELILAFNPTSPVFSAVAASTPTLSRQHIGGFEAMVSRIELEIGFAPIGEGEDWDPSQVLPPMHQSPDYEEHWDEYQRSLTPEPGQEPRRDIEIVDTLNVAVYCVDAPQSAVLIISIAKGDSRDQAEEFIGTFEFMGARHVPLCQEAIDYFTGPRATRPLDEETPTNLRYSFDDLESQMFDAISRYDRTVENLDDVSHVTQTIGSMFGAIDWLSIEGGLTYNASNRIVSTNSDLFVFEDRYNQETFGQGAFGTESGLLNDIVRMSGNEGNRRLTPGDVYFLALKHTRGDTRLAALLAHNTLRSLARSGEQVPYTDPDTHETQIESYGDSEFTGIDADREFFTTYLIPLRGFAAEEGEGDPFDNSGVWYHLFGSMFFEMQSKGESGPLTRSLLHQFSLPYDALLYLHDGHLPDFGLRPNDTTYASRFANRFEQFVRHYSSGRTGDPEKYCVNVWAAQLGASMFRLMTENDGFRLGSGGAKYGPLELKPYSQALPDRLRDLIDAARQLSLPVQRLPYSVADETFPASGSAGSPVTIIWESDEGVMVFHQESQALYGDAPVLMLPVYDADTDTWGASWFDFHTEPYSMTFEGVETGILHFTLSEPEIGLAATWVADVDQNDVLSLDVVPGTVESTLVRADGSRIEPIIAELPELDLDALLDDLAGGVEEDRRDFLGISLPEMTPPLLIGLALLAGIIGITVLLMIIAAVRGGGGGGRSTAGPRRADSVHAPTGSDAPAGPQQQTEDSQAPASSTPRERQAYCSQCGRPIGPGDRFCGGCGRPINDQ